MPRYRNTLVGDLRDQATSRKKPADPCRSVDCAAVDVLTTRCPDGPTTVFDRYVAQQPQCGFGLNGVCCRLCIQGPCRIMPKKEGGGKGICGAHDYSIVARNLVRAIAGGTASHCDHAHHTTHVMKEVAHGNLPDYSIKDPDKLMKVAERLGIETAGKDNLAIAGEVAQAAIDDLTGFEGRTLNFLMTTITEGRKAKFLNCGIVPAGIKGAIADAIAQTTMGMDADPVNLIFGGLRTALADYAGMHLATDLSDILLGTPEPVKTTGNLGSLDIDSVNIATHGHNPLLSEMIVEAAAQLEGEARAAGAKNGIKVVGICCTGNELLMRQGVSLASNVAGQELAVLTGAVDAMVMDVQCFIPGLRAVAECFHTRLITTDKKAKIPGTMHIEFDEEHALDMAKDMIRIAIAAFKNRDANRVNIPDRKTEVIAGFSFEALEKILAAVNPDAPIKVLTDAIESGQLKGVCLFAGCNNLRIPHDQNHLAIAKKLAENDVFMVATGCSAGACGKAGLLTPAAVDEYAGEGLKAFLKTLSQASGVDLPLVLHMGSCVDNTRAADLCTAMANQLGLDVPRVPFAATAPEAMHEKAVSIGSWCVAMGLPVHVGAVPPIEGSALVYGVGTQIAHDVYGGHFIMEEDPELGAQKILDALEYRAWKLRIHRQAAEKYGTGLNAAW